MQNSLVEEKTKELTEALEAVKREQKLVEAIFESIPGYLYVYDENGKLIKWNKNHEEMTGYNTEELSQMTLDKWFGQDEIGMVMEAVKEVFDTGYGEVEANIILKNGDKMLTRA
jgi:diguanylate cyclase